MLLDTLSGRPWGATRRDQPATEPQQADADQPSRVRVHLGPNRRPPLPAGDPITWGALTAGTLLEGTPYPLPPPTRASRG